MGGDAPANGRATDRPGARRLLAYVEDGPNLVTMAMNGWGEREPAWCRSLLANPDATADLVDGSRSVRARVSTGEDRARLWARWALYNKHLDAYAARRSRPTQIVVLEPRPS